MESSKEVWYAKFYFQVAEIEFNDNNARLLILEGVYVSHYVIQVMFISDFWHIIYLKHILIKNEYSSTPTTWRKLWGRMSSSTVTSYYINISLYRHVPDYVGWLVQASAPLPPPPPPPPS